MSSPSRVAPQSAHLAAALPLTTPVRQRAQDRRRADDRATVRDRGRGRGWGPDQGQLAKRGGAPLRIASGSLDAPEAAIRNVAVGLSARGAIRNVAAPDAGPTDLLLVLVNPTNGETGGDTLPARNAVAAHW